MTNTQRHYRHWLALLPGELRGTDADGLGGCAVRTQREVGAILNLTQQGVRNIERRALRKLRMRLLPIAKELGIA